VLVSYPLLSLSARNFRFLCPTVVPPKIKIIENQQLEYAPRRSIGIGAANPVQLQPREISEKIQDQGLSHLRIQQTRMLYQWKIASL